MPKFTNYRIEDISPAMRRYFGSALDWDESKHPRGNKNNAGQFAKKDGGTETSEPLGIEKVYTGSTADYSSPSLSFVGSGVGKNNDGWGLYGTTLKGRAEAYRDYWMKERSKPGYLYEQTFFNGQKPRLADFSEPVTSEHLEEAMEKAKEYGITAKHDGWTKSDGTKVTCITFSKNGHSGSVYTNASGCGQATMRELYTAISTAADNRTASQVFKDMGFGGIRVPVSFEGQKGYDLISFSDDDIKVTNKWKT